MTIQVQRESDNSLLFQSITLNGVTSNINQTLCAGLRSWLAGGALRSTTRWTETIKQTANTTYLDNFSFTYQ